MFLPFSLLPQFFLFFRFLALPPVSVLHFFLLHDREQVAIGGTFLAEGPKLFLLLIAPRNRAQVSRIVHLGLFLPSISSLRSKLPSCFAALLVDSDSDHAALYHPTPPFRCRHERPIGPSHFFSEMFVPFPPPAIRIKIYFFPPQLP